jgi:hypothetical protein
MPPSTVSHRLAQRTAAWRYDDAILHGPAVIVPTSLAVGEIVELHPKDGRMLTRRVEVAKGTAGNPLAPEEVVARYRRLTAHVVSRSQRPS